MFKTNITIHKLRIDRSSTYHSMCLTHVVAPPNTHHLLASVQVEDKTLRLVNSFWHVLTKETGNEALLAEALAWMDARLKH